MGESLSNIFREKKDAVRCSTQEQEGGRSQKAVKGGGLGGTAMKNCHSENVGTLRPGDSALS